MVANEGRQVALIDLARKPLGRFGEAVFRGRYCTHFGEQVADVVNQGSSRVLNWATNPESLPT